MCEIVVWIQSNLKVHRHEFTGSHCVCVCVLLHLCVPASACKNLLHCTLRQDVSHRSHTDPDCCSHYNIRGYPLIWKPSNHGRGRTIGSNSDADVDGSITIQTGGEWWWWVGEGRGRALDSKLLKKGCHLFFLAVFWRKACNSSSGCSRQTRAQRECM